MEILTYQAIEKIHFWVPPQPCSLMLSIFDKSGKKIKIDMPLVIRLAGTNVEEGNKILKESGINYIAATTLEEAANKAVEALKKLKIN